MMKMPGDISIRIVCFIAIFALVVLWELLTPRRLLTTSKKMRWFSNFSFIIGNPVFLRLVLPILAIDAALIAQHLSWGLLNIYNWPFWVEFVAGVVLPDLVICLQHMMFHAIPLLWRFHMLHHADLDYDLSTGLRFHPIEIILSMILKIVVVVILGRLLQQY